jgi:hypothetical protein
MASTPDYNGILATFEQRPDLQQVYVFPGGQHCFHPGIAHNLSQQYGPPETLGPQDIAARQAGEAAPSRQPAEQRKGGAKQGGKQSKKQQKQEGEDAE